MMRFFGRKAKRNDDDPTYQPRADLAKACGGIAIDRVEVWFQANAVMFTTRLNELVRVGVVASHRVFDVLIWGDGIGRQHMANTKRWDEAVRQFGNVFILWTRLEKRDAATIENLMTGKNAEK